MNWFDGQDNFPPIPDGFGSLTSNQTDVPASGQNVPGKDNKLSPGKIIYSKTLTFKGGSHGSTLNIIPESVAREMADKLPEVPKSPSNHFANFLLACQGKEQTRSPFSVFGPMAQMFALGIIAVRTRSKIQFNPVTKTIPNNAFANALLVGDTPRKGWEQYYKL